MSDSKGRFTPTKATSKWPVPELPEMVDETFLARNWKRVAWASAGVLAVGSFAFVPPLPPWPFGGRIALTGVAVKKTLQAPLPARKVAKKGLNLETLRDFVKNVPAPSKIDIRNHEEFSSAIEAFRSGRLTPLSELTLYGDFGQKIAGTFAEGYKLAASRLKARRERMMLYVLKASQEAEARATGEAGIDAKDVVELTIKISDDMSFLEMEDHAYYTKTSAHLVLECLLNGVNVISNVDEKVLMRWGEWKASDFA